LIHIGSTNEAVSPDLLSAPGGFVWWYADLVAPGGDGAVLIWSYGLPFLPGYANAARRGAPQLPFQRPSLNLAVYRRGAPVFYLLQEYPAEAPPARTVTDEQRIGRSTFWRATGGGRCTLGAAFDCDLPGTRARVTGTLHVEGTARLPDLSPDSAAPHLWTPLTGPATGTLRLELDGRLLAQVAGRAYHDRNTGRVPLHELGIERWMWGRVPLADRELVYYLTWPRGGGRPIHFGVEIDADGRVTRTELEVELGRERRTFGGLPRPERVVLRAVDRPWMEVVHTRVVDAGPFYLRMLSEARTVSGETAEGWSELCHPDRVDLAPHRPFVRMRVHRVDGPNSIWLPLFTGPRSGRVARLVRHMMAGGRTM
jgi:hypothetical protein